MPTITIGRSGNGSGGSSRGGSGGSSGSSGSRDYPSGRGHGGGHSSGSSSESKSNESSYGLHNLKELPRIASETTFAATCHGSIAVNSIIDHAITRNSKGYGSKALASLKTLNLSHNYLSYKDAKTLNDGLYGYTLNLQVFNFCNNNIGAVGLDFLVKGSIGIAYLQKGGGNIHKMMQGILTLPTTSIVCLNLANNKIGDVGADILGHALANGKLPATKYIDVSGNRITKKGDTKIVKALKGVWQDIAVFTHTLDEINKMSGDEGKKAQVKALKSIIARGKAVGTYDKAMVVDKSFLGSIKNTGKGGLFGIKWLFGFGKCHLLPESEKVAKSYAQDKIIATLPKKTESGLKFAKKYVGKLISFHDIITCFVTSREEVITSELGQELTKHDLCVIGVDEFCGNQ